MHHLHDYISEVQAVSRDKETQLHYIREARQLFAQHRLRYTNRELADFHMLAMMVCTTRSERWLHQRMLKRCNLEIKAYRRRIIAAHAARINSEPHPIMLEFDAFGAALARLYVTLRHGRV
ncbi:hypothetical protein EON76_05875 [bacterium]|nr:MAG: hypothetical protein EON76_05875 [bacterium]